MFRMKGKFLTNEKGKVMDVSGNKDKENQNIIVWKKHGGLNQQWDVIYADKWKRDPIKGELNSEFGMVVERDFYVVSQMGSKRYLDILGRNIVIKIRNGRRTQKWWFDQKTLTIKSRNNNQSWDIQNSGRAVNMQVWSTNSNWW
jgi:hypothetical protein